MKWMCWSRMLRPQRKPFKGPKWSWKSARRRRRRTRSRWRRTIYCLSIFCSSTIVVTYPVLCLDHLESVLPHSSLRDDGDEDAVTGVRMASRPTLRRLTRIRHPRQRRRAGHLRLRADVHPAPPTIMRTTTSFATEISPTWTPNALSLLGHQICYIFMSLWIRETCLDSSFLIDWLWIWWMDFVTPSLFE
jgi:hypothetical protein